MYILVVRKFANTVSLASEKIIFAEPPQRRWVTVAKTGRNYDVR